MASLLYSIMKTHSLTVLALLVITLLDAAEAIQPQNQIDCGYLLCSEGQIVFVISEVKKEVGHFDGGTGPFLGLETESVALHPRHISRGQIFGIALRTSEGKVITLEDSIPIIVHRIRDGTTGDITWRTGVPPQESISNTRVHAANLGRGNPVIGSLGKPLGDRIEITGTRGTLQLLENQITIESVDNKTCNSPIVIPVLAPPEIAAGVQYRLIGYESGMFRGLPDWMGNTDSLRKPFGFQTFFVVTEVVEPRNK